MISIRHTLLTLTIALATNGAMAQTSFEEISADLNKSGGVYLAYPEVTTRQTPAPKGYTPFYVSHYGRHGSRWMTSDERYLRFSLSLGRRRLHHDHLTA